jgi:hypothetical protein
MMGFDIRDMDTLTPRVFLVFLFGALAALICLGVIMLELS